MSKKEENFSQEVAEKQEHLSLERLQKLVGEYSGDPDMEKDRPRESFIDLMKWVENWFSGKLHDKYNLHRFVHNRIIVDGQFALFCEEKNATIKCLYQDSVISWKTEHLYEKFFIQGVFLIKYKGLEFIHAALFHKSNQFEDEISFFVIVSENNYDSYIKFRNEFDQWVQHRDRGNLHIRVVEGEDAAYTKDSKWEDLFLPVEIKNEIRGLVETFLASKDFYAQKKLPWKRGLLFYGDPGCGKSSLIRTLISEYDFKPVTTVAGANDEAVRDAFSYAEEQSPSLLYFEDLDSMLETTVNTSTFLNLMDGITAKNGLLVIATANNVKKLKANITKRPSRFDRKWEIPLPSLEMAHIYLKKWFDGILSNKECKELAQHAVRHELSYAYLKEIYITSMFEALAHNRKAPTKKDIESTLIRLIKDKNMLNDGVEINTDKYFK